MPAQRQAAAFSCTLSHAQLVTLFPSHALTRLRLKYILQRILSGLLPNLPVGLAVKLRFNYLVAS